MPTLIMTTSILQLLENTITVARNYMIRILQLPEYLLKVHPIQPQKSPSNQTTSSKIPKYGNDYLCSQTNGRTDWGDKCDK